MGADDKAYRVSDLGRALNCQRRLLCFLDAGKLLICNGHDRYLTSQPLEESLALGRYRNRQKGNNFHCDALFYG